MHEFTSTVTLPPEACPDDVLRAMDSLVRGAYDLAGSDGGCDNGATQKKVKVTVSVTFRPPSVTLSVTW